MDVLLINLQPLGLWNQDRELEEAQCPLAGSSSKKILVENFPGFCSEMFGCRWYEMLGRNSWVSEMDEEEKQRSLSLEEEDDEEDAADASSSGPTRQEATFNQKFFKIKFLFWITF